jgi:O-antigen/teichoic acid export membrane protein
MLGPIPRRALANSFATSIAIQGLNAFTGVVLARNLGPHNRGTLAAILLWAGSLTIIGSLGLTDALTYYAARKRLVGSLVGTSIAVGLVQSVVLAAIGFVLFPFALGGFGTAAVDTAQAYLAYVPVFLLNLYAMSILQGLGRLGAFQLIRALQIVAVASGLAALLATDNVTIKHVVATYFAAYLSCLVISGALVLQNCTTKITVDRRLLRNILGFAIRSHSSNVSGMLNERLDQLLISLFLAPLQLGLYVVAVTLTSLTTLVGASVSIVALPTVAGASAEERPFLIGRYVRLTIAGAWVVTIPMIGLTPSLIRLFFGHDYLGASAACRILLLAAVVLVTARMLGVLLKAMGRPLDAGIAEFVALGTTIVCLPVLLPLLGIVGAAVASLVAYFVSGAWSLHRICRLSRLNRREVFGVTHPVLRSVPETFGGAT